jgi:purine-nucleoside phosphorylase
MTSELLDSVRRAGDVIRCRTRVRPQVGVVLGTGLGDFADALQLEASIPYGELPEFPVSTVESHAGELHLGTLAGRPVAIMKGRVHYYEGYTMRQVAFPIRVLRELGCRTIVVTNAVGSMNPDMPPGSIVVTTDHINLMGDSPLIGPNDDELGPRFPDMSEPYARSLTKLAETIAIEQGWALQRAVLVALAGPSLETAAEYRFLRWIGADVVGMSVVPETLVAVHGGQRVLALNVVTDACLPDNLHPVDIPEILRVAGGAAPRLVRLVTEVVRRLDEAA